jgi:hypothetical protein
LHAGKPEHIAAGIRRVKGVKEIGIRIGNWPRRDSRDVSGIYLILRA